MNFCDENMSDLFISLLVAVFYDLKVLLSPKDRVSYDEGFDLVVAIIWV